MAIFERIFFSDRMIKKYATKSLAWFKNRDVSDERKITFLSWKTVIIKAEFAKNSLTYSIHVQVKENGNRIWKYRKYTIVSKDADNLNVKIGKVIPIELDNANLIVPGRAGKYNKEQLTGSN